MTDWFECPLTRGIFGEPVFFRDIYRPTQAREGGNLDDN